MHRFFLIFFLIILFSNYSNSQDSYKEFKEDVYLMMDENSNSKNRKKIRKFFRILKSKELSQEMKSKIYLVLTEFEKRGLYLNAHYVKFFNLFLESFESSKDQIVFNSFLDYLIMNNHMYTDLNLNYIFSDLEKFLKSRVLNNRADFTWKTVGEFNINVNEDESFKINFLDCDLILFNSSDTIKFFNVKGYYDLINNNFNGQFGRSDYINEDVFVEFQFNNFIIDLRKDFVTINNASISIFGAVGATAEGIYKNKLSSSNNFPNFTSVNDDYMLRIFKNFYIDGGFQLKGDNLFIYRHEKPVELRFKNNKLDYLFIANDFQLNDGKIYSANTNFSISNNLGSLTHPSTYFTYDDYDNKISIDRLSGKRGLNPIRNTFHGLSMYVDKMEIDLIDDNCYLFHYAQGSDISVLFESDNYYSLKKYHDIDRLDLNPLLLLLQFDENYPHQQEHLVNDFSIFSGFEIEDIINILLELEIFGFVNYNSFKGSFSILPWAHNFQKSYKKKYDYDSFKIESLAAIGDTVADIDLYLNKMEINKVHKINLTNRYNINLYPMSNKLMFFKNKCFYMDGNIDLGSFAFSGKDISFDYDSFAFYFSKNSLMSFLVDSKNEISSSIIHFDNGILYLDSTNNKSGASKINDFPKFSTIASSHLSYNNEPVLFLINPFTVSYLHDISLNNLSFNGNIFLDGMKIGPESILKFNATNNLETYLERDKFNLYKGKVSLNGSVQLSEKGLFGSGQFNSSSVNFFAEKIHLLSGQIVGKTNSIINGDFLVDIPFSSESSLLSFSPYSDEFIVKSIEDTIYMYDDINFFGDMYFDSENLNGTGDLNFMNYSIKSAHFYFSENGIASADANFSIKNHYNDKAKFSVLSTSIEYIFSEKSILMYKNNNPFVLDEINYSIDFDLASLYLEKQLIEFSNNNTSQEGVLSSSRYGKKAFKYNAQDVAFDINKNELCVANGIQLEIKNFWIQPENNKFCTLTNGDFPVFTNSTLIKKRWLFKDKLINNKHVVIKPSLKHLILDN
tara:strand:+ start:19315 stop:22368 length:3054 start_codon:yes stop_codon:yes gene_type:complete